MFVTQQKQIYPTQLEEFKMPQINLTMEEHMHLTKLVARSYDNNYRSDQFDTDTYDSMADKVFDAVNNLTLEDF